MLTKHLMDNAAHITQLHFKYEFCISFLHNALLRISEEVREKKVNCEYFKI